MSERMSPKVKRWQANSSPSEEEVYKMLEGQGISGYRWANEPGDTYNAHSHSYHKLICVLRGSITFRLPRENGQFILHAGDLLDLPAGTLHEAFVGSEGVTCIESHY